MKPQCEWCLIRNGTIETQFVFNSDEEDQRIRKILVCRTCFDNITEMLNRHKARIANSTMYRPNL